MPGKVVARRWWLQGGGGCKEVVVAGGVAPHPPLRCSNSPVNGGFNCIPELMQGPYLLVKLRASRGSGAPG